MLVLHTASPALSKGNRMPTNPSEAHQLMYYIWIIDQYKKRVRTSGFKGVMWLPESCRPCEIARQPTETSISERYAALTLY